jgi:hypothetical protein
MYNRKIGVNVALMYIGWAWCYESRGKYPECEQIYQKGFANGAQPRDELAYSHKHFNKRMARKIREQAEREAEEGGGSEEDEGARRGRERKALGKMTRAQAKSANRPLRKPSVRSGSGSGGGMLSHNTVPAPNGENTPAAADNLGIFVDPQFMAGQPSIRRRDPTVAAESFGAATDEGVSIWSDIGTDADRRKENEPKHEKFKVSTTRDHRDHRAGEREQRQRHAPVQQQHRHQAPPAPVIEIFVDENLPSREPKAMEEARSSRIAPLRSILYEDKSEGRGTKASKSTNSVVEDHKSSDMAALQKDPLRKFGTTSKAPSSQPSAAATTQAVGRIKINSFFFF